MRFLRDCVLFFIGTFLLYSNVDACVRKTEAYVYDFIFRKEHIGTQKFFVSPICIYPFKMQQNHQDYIVHMELTATFNLAGRREVSAKSSGVYSSGQLLYYDEQRRVNNTYTRYEFDGEDFLKTEHELGDGAERETIAVPLSGNISVLQPFLGGIQLEGQLFNFLGRVEKIDVKKEIDCDNGQRFVLKAGGKYVLFFDKNGVLLSGSYKTSFFIPKVKFSLRLGSEAPKVISSEATKPEAEHFLKSCV